MSETSEKEAGQTEEPASGQSTLSANVYDDIDDVFENAEPWEPIETKLVLWSFGIAAVALAVFGTLINIYLL